jgi:hypothetical protein
MYTHNGRTIQANKAWTSDDGFQHPSNWAKCWGEADLERWSVTFSADAEVVNFDNRFYWSADVPKSLTDVLHVDEAGEAIIDARTGEQGVTIGLKNQYIAQKKAEANDLLSKTDWYVTRKQEKDTAIPSAITTERDAIRTACAGIETKITNASDLDAFMSLFQPKDNGDPSDMDCY